MEFGANAIWQKAVSLAVQAAEFIESLTEPPRVWQVAILVLIAGLAQALAWMTGPRLDSWMREREGLKLWQMRTLITLRQRLRGVFFVMLAWAAVGLLMLWSPFPSRRFLVELVATIASAWVFIGLGSQLIRNRLIRRIVRWAAWIYVTLLFLGLVAPASAFLDSLAVEFGSFRLSALTVLKALAVTGLLLTLARLISQGAARRIGSNQDMSPTMRVLTVKMLQIMLYGAAFFIGLKAVGFDLSGLAVLSGAIGVGLGFGLQKVVSNLVSGVIILLDKSVKPGDVISIGNTFGWIEALGARYVSVVTRDGKEYLIPNEDLITGQVVNWSHSNDFVRLDINFGTSYGDDPHLVRKLAVEAAASVNRVLTNKAPVCHIIGFGDSSVDYVLRFWIQDPTDGLTNIRGNVFLALWDTFKAHGIAIPFPQREVRVIGLPEGAGTGLKVPTGLDPDGQSV